jgi:hypothetical protein
MVLPFDTSKLLFLGCRESLYVRRIINCNPENTQRLEEKYVAGCYYSNRLYPMMMISQQTWLNTIIPIVHW